MKIKYGKSAEFRLEFIFYLGIACILFTDPMFVEIVFGEDAGTEETGFAFAKYLGPASVLISIIFWNKFSSFVQKLLFFANLSLLLLVIESTLVYNSYFIYPHVFSKLIYFFVFFFAYLLNRGDDERDLKVISYFICLIFLTDLFLYQREVLSLSSFLNTDRGFNAESTFLLLVPCLYFFNKYFKSKSFIYLFLFYVNIGAIIFLQHRSVWIAIGIAFFINLLLLRKASFKASSDSYTYLFATPIIALFVLFTFIFSTEPEFLDKLSERANDIVNFKTEGTGSWRYEQFISYLPYIKDHLFFGMRFKGFELPIQFYNPDAGIPYFNDGTGHHFHSFYVNTLFYFGLAGLVLMLSPYFYLIYKITKAKELSMAQIALSSFVFSGIFYGLSYWWPVVFFALFGFTISLFDQKEEETETSEDAQETITIPLNYKKEYI